MRKYENECVDCKGSGLPCIGAGCPNRKVLYFYCDKCGETRRLYEYDERELCIDCIEELESIDCIEEELETVEGTEDFD